MFHCHASNAKFIPPELKLLINKYQYRINIEYKQQYRIENISM